MSSFEPDSANQAFNAQPFPGEGGESEPQSNINLDPKVGGWAAQQKDDYTATTNIVDTQPSAASARVYEWNDEYGDIGPKIPELEEQLFGTSDSRGEGIDFSV